MYTRRSNIGKFGTWTAEEARKEARERLLLMDKGVDIVAEERKQTAQNITLAGAWKIHKEMLKRKKSSAGTINNFQNFMDGHLAHWKNRNLASISRSDVRELHSKLSEKGQYAANNTMRCFRALYNTAAKENEFLPPNPCVAVQWFKEYRRQEPIPDEKLADWYKQILAIPNGVRRDYQLFVVFTGLRRSDACTVLWEDVDLKRGTLHRPNPKGGEERAFTIPLPDICLDVLVRRKQENVILYGKDCPWVFPTKNKAGDVIAMSEPKEIKRDLPSPHRLRDTYTTAANSAGLSTYDIEVLTNHRPANNSVTAGYINQGIDHLHIQQQKVADYLKLKMGLNGRKI